MEFERRYSLKEAQEILGISERTIHRWIKSGKLKSYKPGRDHQIPESAIHEVIERSEVYPKVQAPLPLEFGPAGGETVSQLDPHLWRGYCEHLAAVFEMLADREESPDRVTGWADVIWWTGMYVVNLISTLDEMVEDEWFSDDDNEMMPLLQAAYRMAYHGDRVIRRALEEPDREIEAKFWEIVEGMSLTEEQRKAITA